MSKTSVISKTVNSVSVGDDDRLILGHDGVAISTIVNDGGLEVARHGTSIDTVLNSGGGEHVGSGGVALATTVNSSGHIFVSDGGQAFDTTIADGGRSTVQSGALAVSTTVGAFGFEVVSAGGQAIETDVMSGGKLVVRTSGISISARIESGGSQVVSGGAASNTTVMVGGTEVVSSGGISFQTTIDGSGASSGSLVVRPGGVASDTTLRGGELELRGGTATGFIDFAASGSTLVLDDKTAPPATIQDFGAGDVISVAHLHHASLTFDAGTGQLHIVDGGTAITLQLDPNHDYSGDSFSALTDGTGGIDIAVTCFAAGTAIATPGGPVPVETLRAGDRVLLADGTAAAVRWLGVQTIATRFADPVRAWPIRIRAGALGAGLPVRDLVVSPGHALLIDGLLVHAGALINGDSVQRLTQLPEKLRYYHVELDTHALLLAEGVSAESYLEGVEPMPFDNAEARVGGAPAATELPYPRVKARRQLPPALVAQLAERGGRWVSAA